MYRGKRRGSRAGKRRKMRKLRKSIIRDIDHSGKSAKSVDRAILKGISRKGYAATTIVSTRTTVGGAGAGPSPSTAFVCHSSYMQPFHIFTRLGGTGSGDTNALIALDLIGGAGNISANSEFMRHANMYTQYRIKCVRFEFVPINAVDGKESVNVAYAGPVRSGVAADEVAGLMDRNAQAAGTYWVVKWPNKSGVFQDWGVNLAGTSTASANIQTSAMLIDPGAIKIPVTEKLVLFWKPKVMGTKVINWMPLNQAAVRAPTSQAWGRTVAKPYPWTNIIDNTEAGHTLTGDVRLTGFTPQLNMGSNWNTTTLRMPMTEPVLGCYNSATNQWLDNTGIADLVTGRWTMHTVFEFRRKRPVYAEVTGSSIQENISAWYDQQYVQPESV